MNLLTRETNESIVRHFRVHQYALYPELIRNCMTYLINFGLKYDPEFYDPYNNPVTITSYPSYANIANYSADLLTVKLFSDEISTDYLLYSFMPKLIEETFIRLGGNYYIPLFSIADEPIVLKSKSISVYSLFQPLSLYIDDKRATFMQDNYELSDFIQLIVHDWAPEHLKLIEKFVTLNPSDDQRIWDIFSDKLKCEADPIKIKFRMNQLIFDDWTYELYQTYYGVDPSIDMIIKIAYDRLIDENPPAFGDLSHKRLIFIEHFMKGLFKRVSSSAKTLLNKKSIRSLHFPKNGFSKYFHTELDNQTFYDTVNGFCSIIAHKATFKNPAAKSKLPKSVSELHSSHKCRICSNTIGNTKPGQMVSLVPDQNIDLRFGIFEKNHYQLKHFV